MQRRNSYSDLGLTVAVCVFICILIKSMLFGFTWVGIVWLLLTCAYFYVSWRHASDSLVVRHSTTGFLVLSVVAITGILLFDHNTRPIMHAFAGTGDTIVDPVVVDEAPVVSMADIAVDDTLSADSLASDTIRIDTIINNNVSSSAAQQADTTSTYFPNNSR
jgi:hypothetical protein